ncbi:MAG: mannitol dehydrogenase family protein, partial [Roseibium sp.]|uniref:mannitol dehydrogenase family protein n=1 Tax=Roseibium sp. TaxID=1936156 RepID=UPI00263683C4
LRTRRDKGIGPFTGMSCDNILGNGTVFRQAVVSLARMSDPELADWIEKSCSFPNSMVDCIVPATGSKEIEAVRRTGIEDLVPVTHERHRQWVIEDRFCAGRPALEKVGVTFSSDVHAYETMKIRILNGGHQLLANAGEILSVESIAEAMAHPLIGAFFRKVALEEIVPQVPSVPDYTAGAYVDLISERFANPAIVDAVRRVAFDGSSRHPGFLLPSVRQALAASASVDGLALAEAIWAFMCAGKRADGSVIEPNDPNWDSLFEMAQAARFSPKSWLELSQIYGELRHDPEFADPFARWLSMIWDDGLETALSVYLAKNTKSA